MLTIGSEFDIIQNQDYCPIIGHHSNGLETLSEVCTPPSALLVNAC